MKALIADIEGLENLEVVVENDAKAATLGEMTFGNLRGIKNGAAIILGTGVGTGICIDEQLYKGSHNQAGEVSFWIRERAIYGADSFVGMGLSAVKLINSLAKQLQVENDGPLVFSALKSSTDKEAAQLFSSYCECVAILCFNLQLILDLEKIVIGGGISQQRLLIEKIEEAYQKLFTIAPIIKDTLLECQQ